MTTYATEPARRAVGYAVHRAPYALVRATVLCHPAEHPRATAFRAEASELTQIERELAELRPLLGDALYASAAGHPQDFHHEVVLPLRRSLHQGREPRPALLQRLGELPARVPELAAWLALRRRQEELLATTDTTAARALAAEREALAALCREPALARAVALTSGDLLRAVERAGAGSTDKRARKEEPGVLRYALRASTKTSPLSWFTAVGWGLLTAAPTGPGQPEYASTELATGPLTAVVKVNRALVSALSQALLDSPRRRAGLPHRITSTARISDGQAAYARSRLEFAGGRFLISSEDEVALAATGPLSFVTEQSHTPAALDELTQRLSAALAGPPNGAAAAGFLARLTEAGLLLPSEPLDPQEGEPLTRLAQWLRSWPEDTELADRIEEIARTTARFAQLAADRRPAALADLETRWTEVLDRAGRPVLAQGAALSVLSEDVVAPRALRLDGQLSTADTEALTELTPLAELFDTGHVVRRIVRDRFVARYGVGGSCPHLWEFGAEVTAAWEQAWQLPLLVRQPGEFPDSLAELADLRTSVRAALRGGRTADDGLRNVELPTGLVQGLGARLPAWALERPLSYSYFVQRDSDGERLCVNQVYGGWGRFTSRFLDALEPGATTEVARQIRRGLGPGVRAAQVRPVGGFNANLHPRLLPDEIGPDRRWASIGEADLELVHDPAGDQVRLRLRDTGEWLEVVYAGFLAPVMLPQRLAPLLSDQPHGVVDFRALLPQAVLTAPGGAQVVRTPRLTYRHLVLQRRRWQLPAEAVAALGAELGAGREVPVATTARWRARLDLPEQLFLRPAPAASTGWTADDLLTRLRQPKPQFVDLGNALHLRCLGRWLARNPHGVVLEEALPAPGGQHRPTRAVELVAETYRAGRPTGLPS
ncbi:lantibiotic dehydratase family protein [Kitasatospora sp. NBC_01250]|uniref:lantibiotic dehydratase n=1 Tax=Kitasatospora sp. NBC_01250 TaxID=2903571 RepID=UPI002E36E704|nr:lantibiotic dehydratase [Kitasatospora sp. NBC_01250]